MGQPQVTMGAMLTCSFGVAPTTLAVTVPTRPLVEGKPAATIMDFAPATNIPTFAMCTALTNPTVAAATAAALGVLTPMPCVPVTAPWTPGAATTLIGSIPALTQGSTCLCAYGGTITIGMPGSTRTLVS